MNHFSCNSVVAPAQAAPIRRAFAGDDRRGVAGLLDQAGRFGLRFGLVVVLGWIGAMKFTAYEAEAISGFVANSPLMCWAYSILSERQFSVVLGVVELSIATLIAIKPISPRSTVFGASAAVGMFLTTLSFMATTPGVFESTGGGFPALSALPGQFLIKDAALLGISIWLLADALSALRGSKLREHVFHSRNARLSR